jgi:hypothetical protein
LPELILDRSLDWRIDVKTAVAFIAFILAFLAAVAYYLVWWLAR